MGHTSKASVAWLANLTKTATALKSHKVTVEDVTESDSEDMEYDPMMGQQTDAFKGEFYFVENLFDEDEDLHDVYCVSDSDLEMTWDKEDEEEIQDDAALLNFAAVLAKAQELAKNILQLLDVSDCIIFSLSYFF